MLTLQLNPNRRFSCQSCQAYLFLFSESPLPFPIISETPFSTIHKNLSHVEERRTLRALAKVGTGRAKQSIQSKQSTSSKQSTLSMQSTSSKQSISSKQRITSKDAGSLYEWPWWLDMSYLQISFSLFRHTRITHIKFCKENTAMLIVLREN